ncbi:MAG: SGNH/GDSL hydrolase family protein [Candidatus Anstonellales archaeon]
MNNNEVNKTRSEENMSEKNMQFKGKLLVALGDSITAGTNSVYYSLKSEHNFASYLAKDFGMEIKNYAFPGATSNDVLNQAKNMEKNVENVSIITILVGANDIFRGYDREVYRNNLREIISIAKNKVGRDGIVIVVGLPNIGLLNNLECQNPLGYIDGKMQNTFFDFNEIAKEEVNKAKDKISSSIIFVDIYNINYNDADIGIDCFHPGKNGHEKIKQAIIKSLSSYYNITN